MGEDQNSRSRSDSPEIRKLCVDCMGTLRFSRNKLQPQIGACDFCGETTSVKVEMKSEADDNVVRSLKPVPYPITDQQHKTVVNFWKSWRGIAVVASIAALVYVLFF